MKRSSSSGTVTYYRSIRSNIQVRSDRGIAVGWDSFPSLAANGTSNEEIRVSIPTSLGTYYYGACVEEEDIYYSNGSVNCSHTVRLNVVESRNSDLEFNALTAAGNKSPRGIWSDGTTMWVADLGEYNKIYAYNLATKARDSAKDFDTLIAAGNGSPGGIWSDGRSMWVADDSDNKIYAYNLDF